MSLPTVFAYTTDLPSGLSAGVVSTPGWSVTLSNGEDLTPAAPLRRARSGGLPARARSRPARAAPASTRRDRRRGARGRQGRIAATWHAHQTRTIPVSDRSANARSRADWKRSSGRFSRQWRTTLSNAAGRSAGVARRGPAGRPAGSPSSSRPRCRAGRRVGPRPSRTARTRARRCRRGDRRPAPRTCSGDM